MDSICSTCKHAHIIERRNGDKTTRCTIFCEPTIVPGDLVKCNDFLFDGGTDIKEMREIAWTLNPGAGNRAGFKFSQPKKKVGSGGA